MQIITVLGSTGSIGVSTLDVLARHPERYRIYALTANTQVELMVEQVQRHHPQLVVMKDSQAAQQVSQQLNAQGITGTEVLAGEAALGEVAAAESVDVVMAAIVGAAGLLPTMAAAEAGKRVLLANKEALVMSGQLLMQAVANSGAELIPIDSEHNAIFQCMPAGYQCGDSIGEACKGIRKILLTGSGGPFRTLPVDELAGVTPEMACAHPNWSMGRKISVDSATMMNKGLELIEACWLFDTTPDSVEIVVHPQSVIHSMVQYNDGSVLAQLGNPDMRTPIAHALAYPQRIESGVSSLDMVATARLDFEAPDYQRFPCLTLAQQAFKTGASAMVLLNAANEVAVEAFLQQRIRFVDIPAIIDHVMQRVPLVEPAELAIVQAQDVEARRVAELFIVSELAA